MAQEILQASSESSARASQASSATSHIPLSFVFLQATLVRENIRMATSLPLETHLLRPLG
jgi:hypothetical protein